MDKDRKIHAMKNFSGYLNEGLIIREHNETAKQIYIKNADLSLELAEDLTNNVLKPYLWIIVIAYYSMFYIANAVLLNLGYRTREKIAHQVTNDALIVLVQDKLKKEMMEEYESARIDASEIASIRSEEIITTYSWEKEKRSRFQYGMTKDVQEITAKTSVKRAKEFYFEMRKLL